MHPWIHSSIGAIKKENMAWIRDKACLAREAEVSQTLVLFKYIFPLTQFKK
jgi:hypothetical protein